VIRKIAGADPQLVDIPGVHDIALTTTVFCCPACRGVVRRRIAQAQYHLDTLDRERFLRITRRDDLDKVLEASRLRAVWIGPLKINAVAVKNLLEPDLCAGRLDASMESKFASLNSCRSIRRESGRATAF